MNRPRVMYINKLLKSEQLIKTLHITEHKEPSSNKTIRKLDVIRFDHNIQLDAGCYIYTMKTGMFSTSSSAKKDIIDLDDNSIQIKHRYTKTNLETEKYTVISCEPLYKKNLAENRKSSFVGYGDNDKRQTFTTVYRSAMKAVKTALDMSLEENYYVHTYGRIFKESPGTQVRVLADIYNPTRDLLSKLEKNELDENTQIILLCALTMYFLLKTFSAKDIEESEYDKIAENIINYFNSHQGNMSDKMIDIYLRFLKQVSKSVKAVPKDEDKNEWKDVSSDLFKFSYSVDCRVLKYQGKDITGDKISSLKKSLVDEVCNTLGRDYTFITYTIKDKKSSNGRNIENVIDYYIMSNLVILNNYEKCVNHLRDTLISCDTIDEIVAIKDANKKPDQNDSTLLVTSIVDDTIYKLNRDYINDFMEQYKMCSNELKQANLRAYNLDIREKFNSTDAKLVHPTEGFVYKNRVPQFLDFGKALWEDTSAHYSEWLRSNLVSKTDTLYNLVYSPINYITIKNSILKDSDRMSSKNGDMRSSGPDYVCLGIYEVFTEILMLLTSTYFSISYSETESRYNNIYLDQTKLVDVLTEYLKYFNTEQYPYGTQEYNDCRKVEAIINDISNDPCVLKVDSVINATDVTIRLKINTFVLSNLCKFIPRIIQQATLSNTVANYINPNQTKVKAERSYQIYETLLQQIQAYYLKCAIQLNKYKSVDDYKVEYYNELINAGHSQEVASSCATNLLHLMYRPTKVYDSKELLNDNSVDKFDLIYFIEHYVKGRGFIKVDDIKIYSHIERKMIKTLPYQIEQGYAEYVVHDIWEPHYVELDFAVSYPEFLNLKAKIDNSIEEVLILKKDDYQNNNVREFGYEYY